MEHEDVDMAEVDDGDASSNLRSTDHTIEQQQDDEEEGEEEIEMEERLTWRDDPEDSLSDWTIEITVDGKIYGCYHVHRAILAVGAKKGTYFASLFKNNKANYVESETNTSRIELEILAAQAVPAMLDFMYSSWNPKEDRDFCFTSKNVASLHHLGMYFGIENLCSKAQEFTRNTIPFGERWTCYDHAKHFGDEMMAKIVVELCCNSIRHYFFSINSFSSLIQESDERLWLDIVEHEDAPFFHHNLSILIARFCCSHLDRISVDVFLKLSSEDIIPVIALESALQLMELEQSILHLSNDVSELTSLQKRCIEALTSESSWQFLDSPSSQKALAGLPSLVVSNLFLKSMGRAKNCLASAGGAVVPDQIIVSDAGEPAVNGIYVRTDTYEESACFSMDGIWKNNSVRFLIYLVDYEEDTEEKFWYLSIVDDEGPGAVSDLDFYKTRDLSKEAKLPPRSLKSILDNGIEPGPTLQFRFDI